MGKEILKRSSIIASFYPDEVKDGLDNDLVHFAELLKTEMVLAKKVRRSGTSMLCRNSVTHLLEFDGHKLQQNELKMCIRTFE